MLCRGKSQPSPSDERKARGYVSGLPAGQFITARASLHPESGRGHGKELRRQWEREEESGPRAEKKGKEIHSEGDI